MYYIVNLDNQVVAADSDFLSLLKMNNLQELFTRLISSELKFNELDSSTLEISSGTDTVTLIQNKHSLSTLMGDLYLIELSEIKEAAPDPVDLLETTDDEVKFIIDDTEDDFIKSHTEPEAETDNEINLLPDEESHFLKPAEEETKDISNEINLLPDEEATIEKEDVAVLSGESIFIDIEEVSKILGISKEDYSGFLNEFIDKSISQEETLKGADTEEHHAAVLSLYKLAQMLHLTALSNILEKVEKASGEKEKSAIEAFYYALSNLTTHATETNDTVPEPEEVTYENQICDLILDDVKPIHFDFQINKASEELSLPVDLIEEFIHDFITQAHEEKRNFIEVCKKGDIDELHRIGHKLKGVASNLRIAPLAETLEEIQFCEERSRFEPLLKKYWGQFLAFDLFMKSMPHQEGAK